MATQYLKRLFDELICKLSQKKRVKKVIKSSTSLIKNQILSSKLSIQKRKHFKQKSKQITPEKPPVRLTLREYMSDFKEKAEETRQFSLKFIKEQINRRNRQQQREEQLRQQLLAEIEEREMEKYKLSLQREKVKNDQIREMLEKTKKRKKNIEKLKDIGEREYRKAISTTPLYKIIESNFVNHFEIPELEKRKKELQKKRDLFKPWDYDELKERAKYLEILQSEHKPKNIFNERSKSTKSRFLKRVLDEDKERFMEQVEKDKVKREMAEKKKKYAKIVKEVFSPAVDLLKRKEIEFIKAKLTNPVIVRKRETIERSFSYVPKKFKKNSMIREKPEKKVPVKKDYIREFRETRKKSMSERELLDLTYEKVLESDRKILEKVAGALDREARVAEIKIGSLSPLNGKSLKITEHINSLLVNSIKTKLAILDKT